jgi:DNA-binding PadR family transcriptional regulator
LEVGILTVCVDAGAQGTHWFAIAKALADRGDTRTLTATGTLYRALHRLEEAGLVESCWEDPGSAADEGRPRRRIYRVTGAGATALASARAATPPMATVLRVRPEPAT